MISTHLPNLQAQHALVVIDDKGRGYTWIAGSKEERGAWLRRCGFVLQHSLADKELSKKSHATKKGSHVVTCENWL